MQFRYKLMFYQIICHGFSGGDTNIQESYFRLSFIMVNVADLDVYLMCYIMFIFYIDRDDMVLEKEANRSSGADDYQSIFELMYFYFRKEQRGTTQALHGIVL